MSTLKCLRVGVFYFCVSYLGVPILTYLPLISYIHFLGAMPLSGLSSHFTTQVTITRPHLCWGYNCASLAARLLGAKLLFLIVRFIFVPNSFMVSIEGSLCPLRKIISPISCLFPARLLFLCSAFCTLIFWSEGGHLCKGPLLFSPGRLTIPSIFLFLSSLRGV